MFCPTSSFSETQEGKGDTPGEATRGGKGLVLSAVEIGVTSTQII